MKCVCVQMILLNILCIFHSFEKSSYFLAVIAIDLDILEKSISLKAFVDSLK